MIVYAFLSYIIACTLLVELLYFIKLSVTKINRLTVAYTILYRWNHLLHLFVTYNGWVNSVYVDACRG